MDKIYEGVGYDHLKECDHVLAIDASASMDTEMPNGKTRWVNCQEAALGFQREMLKLDSDGITIIVFQGGSFKKYDNIKDEKTLLDIFAKTKPAGGTPTHLVIEDVCGDYFKRRDGGTVKPICLAIITDGEPTNPSATMSAIVAATKQMKDDSEIGITFLQIGDSAEATAYHTRLDDELVDKHGAIHDIVDTCILDEVLDVTQALVNSFND